MKNLFKILILFISLLSFNSYSQFTAYRADDNLGKPDCGSIVAGVEVWGGFGLMTIADCIDQHKKITNWVLVPYGPGWFGDVQEELYYYNGTIWNPIPDISCAGGGGCVLPADTIYVNSMTGDDGLGTGDILCPVKSLAQAITLSSSGNIIKLEAGTHTVSSQITLGSTNDFALTIVGGSSDATQTIIEAGGANRLIYGNSSFHNGSSEAWVWKNLTIQNFNGADGCAFYVRYADSWAFSNVIFFNNGSTASNVDGGVFYAYGVGSSTAGDYWNFKNCIFDGNYVTSSGEDGGAFRMYDSYINFSRCIFRNNKADDYGGAIYFWSKGSYYFYDCLFYKNWTETDDGGAVGIQSSTSAPFNDVYFINCTFTKNTAGCGTTYSKTNSVLYVYGGAMYSVDSDNDIYLYNTIMYANDGSGTNFDDVYRSSGNIYYYYSCIGVSDADGTGTGEGIIQTGAPYYNLAEGTDPLFNDAAGDDYTLTDFSPTKDAGCDACPNSITATFTDLAGNSRMAPYDIGSYEYQGTPLPIELIYFDAQLEDKVVYLKWVTATEIDNNYFILERTTNGIDFEEIRRIEGAGNSFVEQTYVIRDNNPILGTSYYRLSQTDYNGTTEYFKLEEVVNTPRIKKVKYVINMLGQIINPKEFYNHPYIIVYTDGTYKKSVKLDIH